MTDTPGREPEGLEPEQRLPATRPPAEVDAADRFTTAPSIRKVEFSPERAAQVVEAHGDQHDRAEQHEHRQEVRQRRDGEETDADAGVRQQGAGEVHGTLPFSRGWDAPPTDPVPDRRAGRRGR